MLFLFFQAEDGIRDLTVTGVQTCALPICAPGLMLIRSVPNDCTWSKIYFWADAPSDIRVITDAIPITIPSTVRVERILPCVRLRVAVLNASLKVITILSYYFKLPL